MPLYNQVTSTPSGSKSNCMPSAMIYVVLCRHRASLQHHGAEPRASRVTLRSAPPRCPGEWRPGRPARVPALECRPPRPAPPPAADARTARTARKTRSPQGRPSGTRTCQAPPCPAPPARGAFERSPRTSRLPASPGPERQRPRATALDGGPKPANRKVVHPPSGPGNCTACAMSCVGPRRRLTLLHRGQPTAAVPRHDRCAPAAARRRRAQSGRPPRDGGGLRAARGGRRVPLSGVPHLASRWNTTTASRLTSFGAR